MALDRREAQLRCDVLVCHLLRLFQVHPLDFFCCVEKNDLEHVVNNLADEINDLRQDDEACRRVLDRRNHMERLRNGNLNLNLSRERLLSNRYMEENSRK